MNKQIEEMTKIIWDNPNVYDLPSAEDIAFELYNADYRKASDVVRNIFDEIEACFARSGALPETVGLVDFIKFAELKKKYESEGADDEN